MSARVVFEVGVRLIGFWLVVHGVQTLVHMISVWNTTHVRQNLNAEFILSYLGLSASYGLVGAASLYFAPQISRRVYPETDPDTLTPSQVGPGDVYRIACFVLGVYLFVTNVPHPLTTLVIAAVQGQIFRLGSDLLALNLVLVLVNVVISVLLIFGAKPVSELLTNLRYDPDTIPQQRITIAMLMIVMLIFAATLAIVRWTN